MKYSRSPKVAWPLWVVCVMVFAIKGAFGVPRIPQRDNEVLEVLPSAGLTSRTRRASRPLPSDPSEAAAAARHWIEASRGDGNTRHLGRAQAALAAWWTTSTPPEEILLLRATIKQALHEFEPALRDLDSLLVRDPLHAQAWLTKSTLHGVRGEWNEARDAALRLSPLTRRLTATAAAAAIASMTGQLNEARATLEHALREDRTAPAGLRLWCLTLLGEMAEREGNPAQAERYFRNAIALGVSDQYLRLAYADLLLRAGRPAEVSAVLGSSVSSDGPLLRLALAEQRCKPDSVHLQEWRERLKSGFEAARSRGPSLHLREEARFALELLGNPSRAVDLAIDNFSIQREPADVKILLESAIAARHSEAVKQVQQWVTSCGYEDVQVQRLLEKQLAGR